MDEDVKEAEKEEPDELDPSLLQDYQGKSTDEKNYFDRVRLCQGSSLTFHY